MLAKWAAVFWFVKEGNVSSPPRLSEEVSERAAGKETFTCVFVAWNLLLSSGACVPLPPPPHPPTVLYRFEGSGILHWGVIGLQWRFSIFSVRLCFIMGSEGVSSSFLGSVFM